MSFSGYKKCVEDGDIAILYFSPTNISPLKICIGNTLQTTYGAVKHSELIGKKYGTKVICPKGYIHILHPTPDLWTQALPHRTQILYSTDISMILFQLDITAGSVVVEAGTGSGSLSHSIIRSVMPTGRLLTFEFHKERFEKAAQEFKEHGLSDNVVITHRDAVNEGFQLDHVADAVFLDLPSPWSCIDSAKHAIKLKGGRICSFSPCIEQVAQTCATLTEKGFHDIKTLECLNRKFHVKHTGMPKAILGELTKFEKQQKDKFDSVKHLNPEDNTGTESVTEDLTSETASKKAKISEDNFKNVSNSKGKRKGQESYEYITASPMHDMQGHTGFLTFATLYAH